ncbi:hypothetical protein DFJ73DRAFT_833747 [Zopfochytrium polystomum]|nr:hypothetical protein DFJ73DRAFT_833747 [Zopfochytrium polystomum]
MEGIETEGPVAPSSSSSPATAPSSSSPDPPTIDASDIQAALRVFRTLAEDPDLKKLAASDAALRDLFAVARLVVSPSQDDLKDRRKKGRKEKLQNDHAALVESGIRQLRKVRAVGGTVSLTAVAPALIQDIAKASPGSLGGGSIRLLPPPRVGSVEANSSFADADEQRIQEESAEKSAAILSAAPVAVSAADEDVAPDQVLKTKLHVFLGSDGVDPPTDELPPPKKLNFKRSCHSCGLQFDMLHSFYDQMCLACADLNYTKRFSKADMRGRVCLVTGARVKIGYVIALKLLRMGATVIVTTRFPHDAARRYAAEPDSDQFTSRLTIFGLDFRDIPMLHHFTAQLNAHLPRLDVIINNAAQTVRKPPAFYEHLMEGERAGAASSEAGKSANVATVFDVFRTRDRYVFKASRKGASTLLLSRSTSASEPLAVIDSDMKEPGSEGSSFVPTAGASSSTGTNPNWVATPAQNAASSWNTSSASMSQLALIEGDQKSADAAALFPPGLYDRDDQQVDLRETNSWKLEMGQISTVEMVECHVINAFAPWVVISELKPLMLRTRRPGWQDGDDDNPALFDKYVVNVSAMEGQFYRNKTKFHPHTNMAKASLNMMTRTASAGFAELGIFMTAVDTGWITDENPVHQWSIRENQPPPLDEVDAAMRVLDPVLSGIRGEEKLWGVFLKNYKPTRW